MSLWYCWLWPQSSIMCIMWITHRLWGKLVWILNWKLQYHSLVCVCVCRDVNEHENVPRKQFPFKHVHLYNFVQFRTIQFVISGWRSTYLNGFFSSSSSFSLWRDRGIAGTNTNICLVLIRKFSHSFSSYVWMGQKGCAVLIRKCLVTFQWFFKAYGNLMVKDWCSFADCLEHLLLFVSGFNSHN